MKRRKSGQFATGNRGGPGRPPKRVPHVPPQIGDADQLVLQAMAARDLAAAWSVIQKRWTKKIVCQIARDARSRGFPLPPAIARLLAPRRKSR